jgi:hypothetical protein
MLFQLVDLLPTLNTVANAGSFRDCQRFRASTRTFQIANAYLKAATSHGFGALKAGREKRSKA